MGPYGVTRPQRVHGTSTVETLKLPHASLNKFNKMVTEIYKLKQNCKITLNLLVLKLEYHYVLMPWLLGVPGNQQLWYWLFRIKKISMPLHCGAMRQNANTLCSLKIIQYIKGKFSVTNPVICKCIFRWLNDIEQASNYPTHILHMGHDWISQDHNIHTYQLTHYKEYPRTNRWLGTKLW